MGDGKAGHSWTQSVTCAGGEPSTWLRSRHGTARTKASADWKRPSSKDSRLSQKQLRSIRRSSYPQIRVRGPNIFERVWLMDESIQVVAKSLGMKPGAVRTSKSRVFKRVKEMMQHLEFEVDLAVA